MKFKVKIFAALICLNAAFLVEAADSIIADSGTAFKRIKNSWASVQNGDAIVEDDGAGAFYGVFKIYLKLDKTQYFGNVKVKVYVQKAADEAGDTWRLIKIIAPPTKPSSGDWEITSYWNSREAYSGESASGDTLWGTADAEPYEGNLKIKFKVVEE